MFYNILHNLYPTKFLRYDACLRPIKLKDQMVFPIYRMLNVMWKNLEMKIDIPQVWKEEILHIPPQSRSSRENIQQAKVVVRTSIGITLLTVPQKQEDQGQIPVIMVKAEGPEGEDPEEGLEVEAEVEVEATEEEGPEVVGVPEEGRYMEDHEAWNSKVEDPAAVQRESRRQRENWVQVEDPRLHQFQIEASPYFVKLKDERFRMKRNMKLDDWSKSGWGSYGWNRKKNDL